MAISCQIPSRVAKDVCATDTFTKIGGLLGFRAFPGVVLSCDKYEIPPEDSLTLLIRILRPQTLHDIRVRQRRRVAQRAPLGDVAQQSPHDLSAAGLGQV